MQRDLRSLIARIAIAEGIGERFAVGPEPYIVNGPSVDGDGAHAFGRNRRALRQSIFHSTDDNAKVPAETAVALLGMMPEAMNQFDMRLTVAPAQQ